MIQQTYHGSYPAAGFWRRAGAFFYDSFVIFSVWILATALALWLNKGHSLLPHQGLFLSYLFLVTGVFLGFFWRKKGQTLGMLAWKIAIVNQDNTTLSWRQALTRYLLGWLSISLAGLGFLWCLIDKNKQTLHDKLAHTKVINLTRTL